MADVDKFIQQLGDDVTETYVPTVQTFFHSVGEQIAADAGPRIGRFMDDLVRDIFAKQSQPIRDFLTALIKDLASRYHPQLGGNLTTRVIDNGIEIESTDTKLQVKKRETGDVVTELDIPIFVRINFNDFLVKLESGTVKIKDPQIG